MTLSTILLASLAAFAQAGPAAATADVIRLRSGPEIKGKVGQATAMSVVYTDTAGKTASVKTEDVSDIILGDLSAAFKNADKALAETNWVKAINLYKVVMEELGAGKGRAVLHKPFLLYNWALAQQGSGESAEALKTLKRLRQECGDCRHRALSFQKSYDIAKAKGEGLDEVLEEMKGEGGAVGLQAELELAKRQYAKNDFAAAASAFQKIAASNGPASQEARLWHFRTLRQQKKTTELEALAGPILNDRGAAPGLIQAAGSIVGHSRLALAGKDRAKVRDVLMVFVLAISMGPPPGKEEVDDYAGALMGAGKCYTLLAAATDKDPIREDYKNRAVNYYREVQRFAKGTPWPARATEALAELGEDKEKPKEAPGGAKEQKP